MLHLSTYLLSHICLFLSLHTLFSPQSSFQFSFTLCGCLSLSLMSHTLSILLSLPLQQKPASFLSTHTPPAEEDTLRETEYLMHEGGRTELRVNEGSRKTECRGSESFYHEKETKQKSCVTFSVCRIFTVGKEELGLSGDNGDRAEQRNYISVFITSSCSTLTKYFVY